MSERTPISGTGSTLAVRLYGLWITGFSGNHPSISVNYDTAGWNAGINRFVTGSADFAGTDAPLSDAQLADVGNGALQIPSTAGMIVLAYRLRGFDFELRLPRDLYPEIMAGDIAYWDDPRLQAANPHVILPHRGILVAARLDSSGTTNALTRHFAAISERWRDRGPGVGELVNWRGAILGHGDEGVAHLIKVSDGVIGYVEYGFAARLGLPMATLENRDREFVAPSEAAARSAITAAGNNDPDEIETCLTDPTGDLSYPIISVSWLLVHKRYPDPARGVAVREFVTWGLTEGQSFSDDLGLIPLPEAILARARQALAGIS